jgi:hypothetical protein
MKAPGKLAPKGSEAFRMSDIDEWTSGPFGSLYDP